jgi:hypothetical protein
MAIFLGKQYLNQRDQVEVEGDDDQVKQFLEAIRGTK